MHTLKNKFKEELYMYEEKAAEKPSARVSDAELNRINLLSDTVKNLDKIEILEGGEYSKASEWMGEGRMYGTSYDSGMSGARGRGKNTRRDSMGRYSSEGEESGESYARGGRGGQGGQSGAGGGSYGGGSYGNGGSSYRRNYSGDDDKEYIMEYIDEMIDNAENSKEREAYHRIKKKLEMI